MPLVFSIIFLLGLYWLKFEKSLIFSTILMLFSFSLFLLNKPKNNSYASGILAGIALVVIGFYGYQTMVSLRSLTEWDFLAFYFYGKAGADGLAFYDPASFPGILTELNLQGKVSSLFTNYIIEVGFCYPPTTMLMLAPIGYLDPHVANFVWKGLIIAVVAIDIVLIYNTFRLAKNNFIQVLIIVVLTLSLPGSSTTVALTQTNFFLLFFILLAFRNRDNWKAGIFLGLAVIVKPIAVIWAAYFLISRNWGSIISFASTGIALIGLTIGAFGLKNFTDFFTSNPTQRIPKEVYVESINQSMNAVLSRTAEFLGMTPDPSVMTWIIIILSVLLAGLTCYASYRFFRTSPRASFLIFLPLALLIYPGCLMHYAVQLLPVFMAMMMSLNIKKLILLCLFLVVLSFSSFTASLVILLTFITYAFLGKTAFTDTRAISA